MPDGFMICHFQTIAFYFLLSIQKISCNKIPVNKIRINLLAELLLYLLTKAVVSWQ